MRTYDDVVRVDYTNTEEWLDFVRRLILPLHNSVLKIIKLRETIERLLNENLSELIKNNEGIKKILLGGIDENGEYKPKSLAKLYKDALGISINVKEWISLCRQPGIDASEYVKCEFSDTVFIRFVRTVKEITEKLLLLTSTGDSDVSEDEIKEIIVSPEKIIDELKEIYTHLVSISANHSYYTFFILNTRCIPRYYVELVYPKLRDKFEELVEFLGLEPKFVPDAKDEEIEKKYTLWGHREDGFADLIYKLNGIIWDYFGKEEFRSIFEVITAVRDLKQEYREMVDAELNKVGWKFPSYIYPYKWGGSGRPYWHREYEIREIWLDKCYEVPSWSRYSEREVEFEGKSLMELFNDISPALLLGKIDYRDEKYAEHMFPPLFKSVSDYTLYIRGNRLKILKRGE